VHSWLLTQLGIHLGFGIIAAIINDVGRFYLSIARALTAHKSKYQWHRYSSPSQIGSKILGRYDNAVKTDQCISGGATQGATDAQYHGLSMPNQ
jgi:hypothetical protein